MLHTVAQVAWRGAEQLFRSVGTRHSLCPTCPPPRVEGEFWRGAATGNSTAR